MGWVVIAGRLVAERGGGVITVSVGIYSGANGYCVCHTSFSGW